MNRGYSRQEYLAKVAALKAARPGILITGDIIVGFPGETEDDFLQTLSLMEEVRYTDIFSFGYSPRPETAAAALADRLTRKETQERLDRVQGLQRDMTIERHGSFVGTRQTVLVEGLSKRGDQLYGRTDGNLIVNFAADPSLIGSLVETRITRGYPNSLLGELATGQ
jgi:tRNA-2-methylthio-N6-dimethylallyladenosine synthase